MGKSKSPIEADGEHTPIISIDLWERVQQKRSARSYKPVQSDTPYILTKLIRCPQCGAGMVAGRSVPGKKGREITTIKLLFDFTIKGVKKKSKDLIMKLGSNCRNKEIDLSPLNKQNSSDTEIRDTLKSLNILPSLMVRLTVTHLTAKKEPSFSEIS